MFLDALTIFFIQKLIEQRVLSLPVVDGNGKAIGIVSILDLVVHVLKHFDKANLKQMEKHTFNFYNLVIEKKALQEETISSIEGKKHQIFFAQS